MAYVRGYSLCILLLHRCHVLAERLAELVGRQQRRQRQVAAEWRKIDRRQLRKRKGREVGRELLLLLLREAGIVRGGQLLVVRIRGAVAVRVAEATTGARWRRRAAGRRRCGNAIRNCICEWISTLYVLFMILCW